MHQSTNITFFDYSVKLYFRALRVNFFLSEKHPGLHDYIRDFLVVLPFCELCTESAAKGIILFRVSFSAGYENELFFNTFSFKIIDASLKTS